MATLKGNTIVTHPDTGVPVTLLADEELPEWATGLIGRHVLDGENDQEQPADDAFSPQPDDNLPVTRGWLRQYVADLLASLSAGQYEAGETGEADNSGMPPKAGKGSGLDAWQQYAAAQGIEYAEDASRDEIIAAVEAHQANPAAQ